MDMDIQKMIGEMTDRKCACGGTIYENMNGDWWRDTCPAASDEDMSAFTRSLAPLPQDDNCEQGE